MRTHGWLGSPPADDAEARTRILEATLRVVDRDGPSKTGLTDVAAELGVTRQTVYRYYDGTAELFAAVSQHASHAFLDRLAEHVEAITDPAALLVEAIAYTIEDLRSGSELGLLLNAGRTDAFREGVMTPDNIDFGRAMMARLPIAWHDLGYTEEFIDELVEIGLRTVVSHAVDNHRTPQQLRTLLHRWIGTVVDRERLDP